MKRNGGIPNEKKNGVGRPPKYNNTIPDRAFKLTLLGLTDKELGVAFDVCERTINEWKRDIPEFSQSIKRGKDVANGDVAHSLYQEAVGYEYTEVMRTRGTCSEEDCTGHINVHRRTTKWMRPSATAIIFFLKNRTRKNEESWADVNRTEHTGADGGPIKIVEEVDVSDFTKEELEMANSMGLKQIGKNGDGTNRLGQYN